MITERTACLMEHRRAYNSAGLKRGEERGERAERGEGERGRTDKETGCSALSLTLSPPRHIRACSSTVLLYMYSRKHIAHGRVKALQRHPVRAAFIEFPRRPRLFSTRQIERGFHTWCLRSRVAVALTCVESTAFIWTCTVSGYGGSFCLSM